MNGQIPSKCVSITPSDTTQLGVSSILVGGAGNLIVEPEGNVRAGLPASVTIPVVAGQYFVCRCVRVLAASTASGLTGFIA